MVARSTRGSHTSNQLVWTLLLPHPIHPPPSAKAADYCFKYDFGEWKEGQGDTCTMPRLDYATCVQYLCHGENRLLLLNLGENIFQTGFTQMAAVEGFYGAVTWDGATPASRIFTHSPLGRKGSCWHTSPCLKYYNAITATVAPVWGRIKVCLTLERSAESFHFSRLLIKFISIGIAKKN